MLSLVNSCWQQKNPVFCLTFNLSCQCLTPSGVEIDWLIDLSSDSNVEQTILNIGIATVEVLVWLLDIVLRSDQYVMM